ncbi:MAG: hypothetical protein DHS20C01_14960 [marine bacterium B5-7]|nr:MAG: hypothetical protein DHS20C01_14960 [marine bacterium B5-7]
MRGLVIDMFYDATPYVRQNVGGCLTFDHAPPKELKSINVQAGEIVDWSLQGLHGIGSALSWGRAAEEPATDLYADDLGTAIQILVELVNVAQTYEQTAKQTLERGKKHKDGTLSTSF